VAEKERRILEIIEEMRGLLGSGVVSEGRKG
jgi:hypothetical protein